MEYCSRGTLTDLLLLNGFKLDEFQIASICRELLSGIQYLHENLLIIHRDLKSDNILINEKFGVKISDMGLSVRCKEKDERHTNCVGTPFWVAPEMIHYDETYSFKVDIWSFGIVIWEMM
jgi:serine/threonine protein kinase